MLHPILESKCLECRQPIENPRIEDLDERDEDGNQLGAYFCEHCDHQYAKWPRLV